MTDMNAQQSFYQHLKDLRTMIRNILVIIAAGFCITIFFREEIFNFLRAPIVPFLPTNGLVFTAPVDKFVAYLKVSFFSSILFTCPLWLYQIWKFIAPGLYKHEKKLAIVFMFFGTVLFLVGASFVYYLILPLAFEYLFTFGGTTDQPMITIRDYLSFVVVMVLVFGLAFEMPLVLILLGRMGVISAQFLRDKRRFAIIVMAVLAAVLTPPDVISMMALLIPLVALYEVSIWLVAAQGRRP